MSKFSDEIAEAVAARLLTPVPNVENALTWRVTKHASSAFTGGTANSHGDSAGTGNPYTIFQVEGNVLVAAIYGVCNTSLAGATATVEVGVTGNTAALIAQETGTDIDAGNVFVSATQAVGAAAVAGSGAMTALADLDIIETVGTADITAGQIDYYVVWAPAEAGASVTSA
jgi:hypothetical protein